MAFRTSVASLTVTPSSKVGQSPIPPRATVPEPLLDAARLTGSSWRWKMNEELPAPCYLKGGAGSSRLAIQ
ncbi:hypothetical protein GCM10014719_44670 [Planomonospora parontospora subsp. antibiotica]|nr:hypothetical protein GCM10014719_44670 [Planomonospora parontospora subsp. antibiotica]GII17671.1 hypothetical protein Ppa05_43970 [Planomonospora parontospora subsp. antibiotica]